MSVTEPANSTPKKRPRINVRKPEIMREVEAQVQQHYASSLLEKIKANNHQITLGNNTFHLAKSQGFCYGVERAIDLAYATREAFPQANLYLIGEIIHNPVVNKQLSDMGIVTLPWKELSADYDQLGSEDIVIVPAFGAPTHFMKKLTEQGCHIIDTTCGDVMKVWRRIKSFTKDNITTIIHGKYNHEETQATISRARGDNDDQHFVTIFDEQDAGILCGYITGEVDEQAFIQRFTGRTSEHFEPARDLIKIGMANQTTMLKEQTQAFQKQIGDAVIKRDGNADNYHLFDTICGATQDRQNALYDILKLDLDLFFIVGGYNSSNTTHLVEISEQQLPTYFIREASCLENLESIWHYDLEQKQEVQSQLKLPQDFNTDSHLNIGITAGASCPASLIEATILKIVELRK